MALIKVLQDLELVNTTSGESGVIDSSEPARLPTTGYVNAVVGAINPLQPNNFLSAINPTIGNPELLQIPTTKLSSCFYDDPLSDEPIAYLDCATPLWTVIQSAIPNIGYTAIPAIACVGTSTGIFITTPHQRYIHQAPPPSPADPPAYTVFTNPIASIPSRQLIIYDAAYPSHDSALLSAKFPVNQVNIMGLARPYHVRLIHFEYQALRSDTNALDIFPSELRLGVFFNTTIRRNTTINVWDLPTDVTPPNAIMLQPFKLAHGTIFTVLSCGIVYVAGVMKGFAVISSPTIPSNAPPAPGAVVSFVTAFY